MTHTDRNLYGFAAALPHFLPIDLLEINDITSQLKREGPHYTAWWLVLRLVMGLPTPALACTEHPWLQIID